jgi:ferritin-like metal-binding protein YciE
MGHYSSPQTSLAKRSQGPPLTHRHLRGTGRAAGGSDLAFRVREKNCSLPMGGKLAGMSEPRELFLHELGDLLFAEQTLVKALPKLAEEATDEELKAGFESHLKETKQHVENLKAVFEAVGEEAKAEKCPGIEGIKKEHDEFMAKEDPSPEVRNLFLTGAGARAEHYEIAAYTGLITLANGLGETDVVPLLEENLDQEKAALKSLEAAAGRLSAAR